MEYIVQQASNVLILVLLGIGSAYSASAPSKPYKVCPTPTEAKDFPCVAMKPTSTIAIRAIVPEQYKEVETPKEQELRKLLEMKESEIKALNQEIELLHQMLKDLMDRELQREINVTTPSQDDKN